MFCSVHRYISWDLTRKRTSAKYKVLTATTVVSLNSHLESLPDISMSMVEGWYSRGASNSFHAPLTLSSPKKFYSFVRPVVQLLSLPQNDSDSVLLVPALDVAQVLAFKVRVRTFTFAA